MGITFAAAGGLGLILLWRGREMALLRRDLAYREQAEAALRKTNRALRVISECNQVLVRATTEAELLQRVCALLVEHGGYRMAWVGFAEQDETKSVRPVAHAGFEAGYLDTVNITWADTERGRGPTGTAIRTGEHVIARNIPDDPAYGLWRAAAVQRGYASSLALPLKRGDRTFGALMVYAAEPDAFNDAEVGLLTELADDLAYGVTALRARAERERVEAELQRERDFLEAVLNSLPGVLYCYDANLRFLRWNKNFERVTGYGGEEIARMSPLDFFAGAEKELVASRIREVFDKGVSAVEADFVSKDGTRTPYYFTGLATEIEGRRCLVGVGVDISDRKRAEAERDRLFNHSLDLLCVAGFDGFFKQLNPAWQKTLGWTVEELKAKPWLDFVHPDDRAATLRAGEGLLGGRVVRDFENRYRCSDGSYRWLSWNAFPLAGEGMIFAVVRDVTEHKQAEAERQKFVMLAESSSEFIGMCDLDMKPLYVNPAGVRMVGLPDMAAACRVKVQDYFFPEDQRFIAEEFFPRVMREGHGHVEIRLRHFQSGEPIWMFYYLFSVRDASGTPVGWATVSRDITERKRTEAALRESEERLRLALDAAHMGTFDWDMQGSRITWSRWHEELWGFKSGGFPGTYEAFAERVHPEDLPGVNAEIARCIAAREPFTREFRVVWPDGSVHWIVGRGEFTFDADGRPARMRGAVIEITERKQAEEALRALAARLQQVREEERTAIARELHDQLGQALTGLKMDAAWLGKRMAAHKEGADALMVAQRAQAMAALIDSTIQLVRRICTDLRPGILDDLGLAAAIEWQAGEFQKRPASARPARRRCSASCKRR
ncbi:MAG: PAS domain S-box protein [Verrucomicrobiae bacterium]|nr:PAS domain S-box protein [Verrucomicrobiae bacterium]